MECLFDTVPTAAQLRSPVGLASSVPPGSPLFLLDPLVTVPTAGQLRAKSPRVEHPPDSQGPGVDSVPAAEPRQSSAGDLPSDSEEEWVSDDEHYWGPG